MPKDKKINTNMFGEEDYEVIEAEFNQDIINDFSSEIETSINRVVGQNLKSEYKLELMTVLLSFSAQVAADIDILEESFLELASALFTEAVEIANEEDSEDSELKNDITLN